MPDEFTILIVEDNDFVRVQMAKYLADEGFRVLEATEGGEALECIEREGFVDLFIVDVRMEPMGGFEFLKDIRGDNVTTPVVLVTGDQTTDLLERANSCGVAAVLLKPVEKDRLVKTVQRTIANSKRLS